MPGRQLRGAAEDRPRRRHVAVGVEFQKITAIRGALVATDPNCLEGGAQAGAAFASPRVARGLAYGDFDRDGDVDLLITTNQGPAYLYRNDVTNNNDWLEIKLQGTVSNRDAIGAKVQVKAGGKIIPIPTGSGRVDGEARDRGPRRQTCRRQSFCRISAVEKFDQLGNHLIGRLFHQPMSPALHNAGFAATGADWVYAAFEVPPGGAGAASSPTPAGASRSSARAGIPSGISAV